MDLDLRKLEQDHDGSCCPEQCRDDRRRHDGRSCRNRLVERLYRDEGPNGDDKNDSRNANGRQGVNPDRSAGNNSQAVPSRFTDPPFMLLLVGIPGSGKSHLASELEKAVPNKYVRVNQDTLGNRRLCVEKTRQVLVSGKCPIIDRCNFNESQRRYFLDIARYYNVPVDCVVFDIPKEECIRRCATRLNHETVSPREARQVVERMVREFSAPVETFRALRQVSDLDAVRELIIQYSNVH